MDAKFLELLVCPVTKGPMTYDREHQELVSRSARLAYPVRDGMPILLEIIETAWLRCAPTLTLPQYAPGLKRYPLHVAALQALRQGDGAAASEAIRADIASATADICPLLDAAAAA